jgi:two-component system, response regulator YesN
MIGMIVADDELIIRQGLMTIPWNNFDIEVRGVASSGEEALELVKSFQPEILLTDIRMPGMGGLKLIEAVKSEFPDIKAILLTGYQDFNYAHTAIQLGAFGYILKPSDPDEIIDIVLKAKKQVEEGLRKSIDPNRLKAPVIRNKVISEILGYIEKFYMEDISLISVSEYVFMNHIYISRLIKKETGETFLDILTRIRMDKACQLLANSDKKTYEISDMIGIKDSGYFSQVFKKYNGVTPSEYREKLFSRQKCIKEAKV